MCGLTGFIETRCPTQKVQATIQGMTDALTHRGQDDSGFWFDEKIGIALGHRRLSILDLSSAGHQPMHSPCGRYVLVYNGEIYNHMQLRKKLENDMGTFAWHGHCDTETLLAGLIHWGLDACLEKLNGMFAFALWDKKERHLILARDRMGEKPLYYGRCGGTFLFGSELKALAAHPDWRGEVDRDALALYMRHNYVPAPWSIYKGIAKLLPASYVVISENGRSIGDLHCYWNLGEVAKKGTLTVGGEPETMIDDLDNLLRDAVSLRMTADVPLGVFLSGGYDSTAVAAIMQTQSLQPVKTFSIGFHEKEYNEAKYAKAVAEHLGTNHTELYVSPEEAMAVIPKLPIIYDEPFSDSSQIPTFLVSHLARQHVTVSLSGDGGDELFFGYKRYFKADRIWKQLSKFPFTLRRLAAELLRRAPGSTLEKVMDFFPRRLRINHLADRLPKLFEIMAHQDGVSFYRALISSQVKQPDQLVLGSKDPDTIFSLPERLPNLPSLREEMMYLDMMSYLPDDILTKVDRASMAVGLEVRIPMLDHRLVEFAWRVPTILKHRDGQGKWILRQVLNRYVPNKLINRPKMGFGLPIEHWLRGPLRGWAESLLNDKRLRDEGFFDPELIRKIWQEHLTGQRRWHSFLWTVLMFQAWYAEQKNTP